MIIDEIKKANMQAMKDRNVQARAIYGVVMNKAMLNKIEKKRKRVRANGRRPCSNFAKNH